MKIAFYLDSEDARLRACARQAIAAARRSMPAARILHLAGLPTGPLPGVDECIMDRIDGNFAYRRSLLHARLAGEVLLLDVDCMLRADVSGVFRNLAFDVALPAVDDPFVRFTGGVAFSRAPGFWAAWAAKVRRLDITHTREHLKAFMAFVQRWPGIVECLEAQRYERLASRAEEAAGYPGAAIVHYRGPRKRWMLERAGRVAVDLAVSDWR